MKQEACLKIAKKTNKNALRKWDPNKRTPYKDNLDHMEKRKKQFQRYTKEKANLYNPDITEKEKPEDAIRIFIKQNITEETAKQKPILREHKGSGKKWIIHTDSSCKDGNTSKARAGARTYCDTDNSKTKAIKILRKAQTNQRGKLIAILTAIKSVKKGDELEIISDSKYSLKGIIEGIPKWTDEGWINMENKDIFQRIAYALDTRGAKTTFKWVKGHSGDKGNENADKKPEEGANKEKEDTIDLTIPKECRVI